MRRNIFTQAIAVLILAGAVSCGSSIKNAQDFVPNKAPEIESIKVTDSSGNAIDTTNILLGMKVHCVITASDPEKQELSYSFNSSYGSTSGYTVTSTGCEVDFTVTSVPESSPVYLGLTVTDVKKASASMTVDIGSGKGGPIVTLNNPSNDHFKPTGSATITFNATSNGWYQVLESDSDITDILDTMNVLVKYTAGSDRAIKIAGALYAGSVDINTVKVSADEGSKKIWILFKDNNNFCTSNSYAFIQDGTNPSITSTTPADLATSISTDPVLYVTFSEDVNQSSISAASSCTLSGSYSSISFVSYDAKTYQAAYSVKGLLKNTWYTATLSGVMDLAGNEIASPYVFKFMTTPTFAVTYDKNGAGSGSLPIDAARYDNGQSVTVLGNTGSLVKTGYTFAGWNTKADGSGISYSAGAVFAIQASDVTLYAVWSINSYTVTYSDISGATGSVPGAVTVPYNSVITISGKNTLVRTGYTFAGWNTQSDGNGITYAVNAPYTIDAGDVTLYAKWTKVYYTVTYSCTGYTRGSLPAVKSYGYGDTVTVSSFSSTLGYMMKQESQSTSTSQAYYCKWSNGTTVYAEEATFPMPDSNITLTATWNNFFQPYDDGYGGKVISKGPSGGYIVYDKGSYSNGWRYMEIAANDQSSGCLWWTDQTITVGGTVATLGQGLENTTAIITKLSTSTSYAALICRNCTDGGYSDWFLPSLDETNTIKNNVGSTYSDNPVCGFQDANYWTSTEQSAGWAYYVKFRVSGVSTTYILKNNPYGAAIHVRAVRRF